MELEMVFRMEQKMEQLMEFWTEPSAASDLITNSTSAFDGETLLRRLDGIDDGTADGTTYGILDGIVDGTSDGPKDGTIIDGI
jgi:hypothetical protein